MLNGSGGKILIGITDAGKIVGQTISDNTKKEIAEHIKKIEPTANIVIQYIPIQPNHFVIVLTVLSEQNLQKPYIYDGRAYHRIESTTSVMKQSKYHELLSLQSACFTAWETSFSVSSCELDDNQINRMIKLSIESGRIPESSLHESHTEVLERLGLIKDKKPTNAAVVLFGLALEKDYPQCLIKLARFKGINKLQGFIDNKQFYCNAFEMLDYAETFFKTYLPISSTFKTDSFQRKDELAIPFLALREAIVNAICHRDYSDRSGEISIAIYDGTIEIWSKGKLPNCLTIDDLIKKHASCPRNKLISEVFYKCGYIEKWGSGTLRILALCKERGLPKPTYSEYSGGFSIEFSYKNVTEITDHSEFEQKVIQQYLSDITTREKEILKILFDVDELTSTSILKRMKLSPSERTIRNDLVHLQKLGLIQRKGAGSNVTWHVIRRRG